MKAFLSVLTSSALVTFALAIPQTFNNGFFGAVGQQVEDVVAQAAAFDPEMEPKGQWSPVAGKPDVLKLDQTAVAFGVPASEVTAERKDRTIANYRILYRAADDRQRVKQRTGLEARVLAGVSAYTGQRATTKAPIVHKGVKIAVQRGKGGDVMVEITRGVVNLRISRRTFLAALPAAWSSRVLAQQFGPPFPAEALSTRAMWENPVFLAMWDAPEQNVRLACRSWPGPCSIFGVKAHGATAFFENGQLRSISILLLDAGAWFGYVPDNQAEAMAMTRGPEFLTHFAQVSESARRGIAAFGKSQEAHFGERTLLKHSAQVTQQGEIWSRLVIWPEHSVKLTLVRDEDGAKNLLAQARRAVKGEAQSRAYAALVQSEENGDHRIDHIPLLPQGNRAYCGVSVLAMIMQHMGVRLETEELAAGAGIRFGSTRNAKTREIYDAAAAVGGLRMDRAQRFETVRARASIDAGFPAVVFRHWSQERDFLHTQFSARLAREPHAELPRADLNDRKLWPRRGGFAHASVIHGYNAKRGEVIFTESWGERARNRRMRQEELEGTSYLACYPRLM